MFCPNCGKKNYDQQKFCRGCGMNLEQSALSLQEQFQDEQSSLAQRNRHLERFGGFAFSGFLMLLFVGVLAFIYMIVTNLILPGTRPLLGVFLALFVLFAVLTLIYVIFAQDHKEKRKATMWNPISPDTSSNPETAKLLSDAAHEPISSVVEDTTDLLPSEKKTRQS